MTAGRRRRCPVVRPLHRRVVVARRRDRRWPFRRWQGTTSAVRGCSAASRWWTASGRRARRRDGLQRPAACRWRPAGCGRTMRPLGHRAGSGLCRSAWGSAVGSRRSRGSRVRRRSAVGPGRWRAFRRSSGRCLRGRCPTSRRCAGRGRSSSRSCRATPSGSSTHRGRDGLANQRSTVRRRGLPAVEWPTAEGRCSHQRRRSARVRSRPLHRRP